MKIGQQDITGRQDVQHHLSNSLTADTEGLKGVDYLGKIFSNLGNMVLTKFHRIQTLFEEGKWVNNEKVMTNLLKEVKNLDSTLIKRGVTEDEVKDIRDGVAEMKEVCKLLRRSGVDRLKVEKVVQSIDHLLEVAKEAETSINTSKLTEQHIQQSDAEILALRKQVDEAKSKVEDAEENVGRFQVEIGKVEKRLKEAEKNVTFFQGEHGAGVHRESQVRTQLQVKEKEVTAAQAHIKKLEADVVRLQGGLGISGADQVKTKGELGAVQKELAAAQSALLKMQGERDQAHRDLQKTHGDLSKEKRELEGHLKKAEAQLEKAETSFERTQLRLQKMERELEIDELPVREIKGDEDLPELVEIHKKHLAKEAKIQKEQREGAVRIPVAALGQEVREVIDLAYQQAGFEKALGKNQGIFLKSSSSSTDNQRLNALKGSKAYALENSVEPIAIKDVIGEAKEAVRLIRKGFEQSGQKIPKEIEERLAGILEFTARIKEPTPISKVKAPEGLDKKLESNYGKQFLEDQKIKMGKQLSELAEVLTGDAKFRQALGEGWIRSGDSAKLTALAEQDFSEMSLEDIEKTLHAGEALIAQAFVKMNKPLPEAIKERIAKINEFTKKIENRAEIVTADAEKKRLFKEAEAERKRVYEERVAKFNEKFPDGKVEKSVADLAEKPGKRKVHFEEKERRSSLPDAESGGLVDETFDPKAIALTRRLENELLKRRVGEDMAVLIDAVYQDSKFKNSLGKNLGKLSTDNRNLRGIQAKLRAADKLGKAEIKKLLVDAAALIDKGFEQLKTVAPDKFSQQMGQIVGEWSRIQ